jgi:hypothetical protein
MGNLDTATRAVAQKLGDGAFEPDEIRSLAAYYCGAIFDPQPRPASRVFDAVEYFLDASIALSLLVVTLLIYRFNSHPPSGDDWKQPFRSASLMLVAASVILLLWPPLNAASADWIHTFDPALALLNPMALVPLYLITIVILTLHFVTGTAEKVIAALVAVFAAAFNGVAVFNPSLVGRVFKMNDIGSFAFFAVCTVIELSVLAWVVTVLGKRMTTE